ncbi:MAG: hypothetical protein KDB22_08075 [Planctomycetales bacterium]|nr:hypothetical protein [Planctomycetales bacterium]
MQRVGNRQASRRHDGSGPLTFWFETLCIVTAVAAILAHLYRLWQHRHDLSLWMLAAILLAWLAADFVSGLVHWLADTWGSEAFPILGPRFIKPFRVHHVTPNSFLECNLVDTNGDTSLVALPVLTALWMIPLSHPMGLFSLTFGVAFCAMAIPTNQIHQWAHMRRPPGWVRWLQRRGLILSHREHARHHALPHEGHYCITTGFCNQWLEKIKFFRCLEAIVTRLTGVRPRLEEEQSRSYVRTVASRQP